MLCNLSSILLSYNEAFSSIELNGGMMKGDFRYKQKAVYVCSSPQADQNNFLQYRFPRIHEKTRIRRLENKMRSLHRYPFS